MKQIFTFQRIRTAVLALCMLFMAASAFADSFTVDGITYEYYQYNYHNNWQCTVVNVETCEGDFTIPSSVTYGSRTYPVVGIGNNAFQGRKELTSITIPNSVKRIGTYAFQGCTGLTSITIPDGVTGLGNYAFEYCSGLKTISLPSSVSSIGWNTFQGCTLNTLFIHGNFLYDSLNFYGLGCKFFYAPKDMINKIKQNWSGLVLDVNEPYAFNTKQEGPTYIVGEIIENPCYSDSCTLSNVSVNGENITPDAEEQYLVKGLKPKHSYNCTIYYKFGKDEKSMSTKTSFSTTTFFSSGHMIESTQTTQEFYLSLIKDPYATLDEYGLCLSKNINNRFKAKTSHGIRVNVFGLQPATEHTFYPYAIYDGEIVVDYNSKVHGTTQPLSPNIIQRTLTPTTFTSKAGHTQGDATVKESYYTFNNNTIQGDSLFVSGLNPNTSYTVTYTVTTVEGSSETATYTFTTPELELTTLQPRSVSNTCAIVAATTNIHEEETNVGFQWRKYDAPSALKSNEGYAAIYDGQLEGYIKNLQPTSYYNVRAFYQSGAGMYYYSDWVMFDPSDFSYFEPTVHTYPAQNVTETTVQIKGYVLPGTDAVTEQGFEYWPLEASSDEAKKRTTDAQAKNVITVTAKGQVMQVVLDGLMPSTTYCYRAFVTTVGGTIYGEEHTFTTAADESTGIEAVNDNTIHRKITVSGYYDLKGHKMSAPQKGLNIVRYSDGTTRKVLMK